MLKEVKRSEIPGNLDSWCRDTINEFLDSGMEAAIVSHEYYTPVSICHCMSLYRYDELEISFREGQLYLIRKDGE